MEPVLLAWAMKGPSAPTASMRNRLNRLTNRARIKGAAKGRHTFLVATECIGFTFSHKSTRLADGRAARGRTPTI
jgi:hypothetical protein